MALFEMQFLIPLADDWHGTALYMEQEVVGTNQTL